MNLMHYSGIIPVALLGAVAATQTNNDVKSQLLELGYALLGLLSTILIPYVIQRVRMLTLEIRAAKAKAAAAATSEDVTDIGDKIAKLEETVVTMQLNLDVTTEERDSLLREREGREQKFQETLLTMKNESFEKEKKLREELEEERQLNSNMSRQYDQLAREFRELKNEVATMRGANILADQIMAGINTLINAKE